MILKASKSKIKGLDLVKAFLLCHPVAEGQIEGACVREREWSHTGSHRHSAVIVALSDMFEVSRLAGLEWSETTVFSQCQFLHSSSSGLQEVCKAS